MRPYPVVSLVILVAALPAPLAAQHAFARSNLDADGGIGIPWQLDVRPAFRFTSPAGQRGIHAHTTFAADLGMPGSFLAAFRFAPQSPTVERRPDEWEARLRWQPVRETTGAPADVTGGVSFNGAARSLDAELAAARWFGGLRSSAGARLLGDAFGSGGPEAVLTAGAFVFPRPAAWPVAVGAEAAAMSGERVAWSASGMLGVPYSTHSLEVFVTNTAAGTLHGTSRGTRSARVGIAFTAPIPVGRVLGLVVPRERARRSVETDAPAPAGVRTVIFRHDYVDRRIEVERGTVIEWTNRDHVVHTVSADDGTWDSGAIQPGEAWRARFDEPGIYPYHCGPHPYMKGAVIVR
jgi:plastocyanin